MANRLSMAKIHSIQTLYRSGHSNREIARLLAIDRGTVNAYVRRLQAAWSEAVIQSRGVEGVRVLMGLKALVGKHRSAELVSTSSTMNSGRQS